MPKRRVQAILFVVPALWGLVFVGVNELLPVLAVTEIVVLRFSFIVLAFGLLLALTPGLRPVVKGRWGLIVFAGIVGVPLSQLAIVYAQNFLAPTLAAILITSSPAATALIAPLMVGERLSNRQRAGSALALVGAVVVIVLGAGGDASFEISNIAGAAVGLITPVAWALYTISLKKMSGGDNNIGVLAVTILVGSVFLVPFAPSAARAATDIGVGDWAWIVYLAIGGTLIAYALWYWSLRYLDASETASYLYLVPVAALVWSLIVLGEAPAIGALAGGALVIVGVWLTQASETDKVDSSREAVT